MTVPVARSVVLLSAICLAPLSTAADAVIAARNLPSGTVLAETDLSVVAQDVPGAASRIADVVGMEVRQALYAGKAVTIGSLGQPALVERNQIVTLQFHRGGLAIVTEGRALGRAAAGEWVRVLNLASRETVTGVVRVDGAVSVQPR